MRESQEGAYDPKWYLVRSPGDRLSEMSYLDWMDFDSDGAPGVSQLPNVGSLIRLERTEHPAPSAVHATGYAA
jgi:hypothetical protein